MYQLSITRTYAVVRHFGSEKKTDLIAKIAKHRFNRTEEEGEGHFELKLIKKGFEGQEVTILKEILDLCYILVN